MKYIKILPVLIYLILLGANAFSQNDQSNENDYLKEPELMKPGKKITNKDFRRKDPITRFVFDGGIYFPSETTSGPSVPSDSGWGSGYGGSLGVTIESGYPSFGMFRFDVNYFKWSNNKDVYKRMPFFIGGRGYMGYSGKNLFYPFWEFGLELSSDTDVSGENTIHFGVALGVGFEIRIKDLLILGVDARGHFIKHMYFSAGPYIGIIL